MPKFTDDNRSFFERYGKDLTALYGNIQNINVEDSFEELQEKYNKSKLLAESQNRYLKMSQTINSFKKEHNNENGNEDLIFSVLGYNDKDKEFYNEFSRKNLLPGNLENFGGIFNDYLQYYGNMGKTGLPYMKSAQTMSKDLYLKGIENNLLQVKDMQKDAFKNGDVQFLDESLNQNPVYTQYLRTKGSNGYYSFPEYLEGTGQKQDFFKDLTGKQLEEATQKITGFKKDKDRKYGDYNSKVSELADSFYRQHAITPFDKETYARMKKEIEGMRLKDKAWQPKMIAADQNDNTLVFRDNKGNIITQNYDTPKKDSYPNVNNLPIKLDPADGKYYRHEVVKKGDGTWEMNNTKLEATEDEFNRQQGMFKNNAKNFGYKKNGSGYQKDPLGYVPGQLMIDYYNILENNYKNGKLDENEIERYNELETIIKNIYNVDTEEIKTEIRNQYQNSKDPKSATKTN